MALKNPLGMIKDVAVTSLKAPVTVAGSAVGLAKATTGKAAEVVTSLVTGGPTTEASRTEKVANEEPDTAEVEVPEITVTPTEPVNVIDELGLDPAPVAKPKPRTRKPAKKPVTKIDAAADPSDVAVTPADIAKVVSKD